jgi:hypothetical protein
LGRSGLLCDPVVFHLPLLWLLVQLALLAQPALLALLAQHEKN